MNLILISARHRKRNDAVARGMGPRQGQHYSWQSCEKITGGLIHRRAGLGLWVYSSLEKVTVMAMIAVIFAKT